MSETTYTHRIYCTTEGGWAYLSKTDTIPLTDCPNNVAHTTVVDSASIIDSTAALSIPSAMYGTGSDGSVTIAVNTSLTRDYYYQNLTVNNGIVLNPNGFRIFVRGTLTLNGTASIEFAGRAGVAGSGTSLGGAALAAGSVGGGGAGAAGAATSVTGGTGGGATSSLGGNGGAGGNGGGSNGGAGGTATVPIQSSGALIVCSDVFSAVRGRDLAGVRLAGGAGGGGGGNGNQTSAPSSNGGGGGGGGGVIIVVAYTVSGSGTIAAPGGAGGDGSAVAPATTLTGGGPGGGGGGGGIILVYAAAAGDFDAMTQVTAAGGAGGAIVGGATLATAGTAGNVFILTGL